MWWAPFWTRPAGVRVQKVQKVQRVVVGAFGASFDKTLKPPCRAGKTSRPGLWPDGNAPLSPPAAAAKTIQPRLRHRSGDSLESPFMCRLRTNFARLGDPMQGPHNGNAPLSPPTAVLLLKVKRLTTFCASLTLLQNVFAVHPGGGSLLAVLLLFS